MKKLFFIFLLVLNLSPIIFAQIPDDLETPNDIGMAYLLGIGVEKDYKKAMEQFMISAKDGNEFAQANIGLMYSKGKGVKQDYKSAAEWLNKSAIQGNASAQTSLGYLYDHGEGVDLNHEEAVRLYRLAVDQGYPIAQRNLGFAYKNGTGVNVDLPYAFMWFFIANTDDLEKSEGISLNQAKKLIKTLNEEEISEAVQMVSNCIAKNFKAC